MNNAARYVEQALESGRVIFHTMGDHAGESPEVFVARKQLDIAEIGYTFWYARSLQPPNALKFCETSETPFVLFYERKPESSRKRRDKEEHSGEDTNVDNKHFGYMTEFCCGNRDTDSFLPIPGAMRQHGRYVTGRVDRGACGFTFDYLQLVRPELGFNHKEWKSVFKKSSQAGVWCATKCESDEEKTWYVVAVARLCKPYAVWFRGERGVPPVR